MRTISDKQGLTLKAATRRGIDQAGGGDALQHVTRVKAGALSKYATVGEDTADKFMPIDIAVECDLEANSPIIVSAMAAMLGYKLVPADDNAAVSMAPITLRDGLKIANEAADVVKAITEALEDENIDALEKRIITREIDQAMQALQCVLRRIGGAA
ncbi:hypothetical protein J2Y48_003113 [Mycoplana sp. BE70]|uniref:phage regulatory CII family protein n=1 Tax=Mycoplana sp. BE70 TaxID=2817775 RepID=UPI002859F0EA|nr:phage regulatory CII family protein [Mycoplana sp. BE70]MDR6757816.1 hypothetical protein [Mycoplana sp. BE70]